RRARTGGLQLPENPQSHRVEAALGVAVEGLLRAVGRVDLETVRDDPEAQPHMVGRRLAADAVGLEDAVDARLPQQRLEAGAPHVAQRIGVLVADRAGVDVEHRAIVQGREAGDCVDVGARAVDAGRYGESAAVWYTRVYEGHTQAPWLY